MMKALIGASLLAVTCAWAGDNVPVITQGVTNRLGWNTWIYTAKAAGTNMSDVVLFQRRPSAPTPCIVKAKAADIDLTDPAILRINLRDVTINEADENGQTRTIRATLYPVRIDRKEMQSVRRDYGAQSGSPFEQITVSNEPFYYPAQEGETIETISALFGVSQKELLRWNPALITNALIRPGQKILFGPKDKQ